jgi:hypothetical protein
VLGDKEKGVEKKKKERPLIRSIRLLACLQF